MSINVPQTSSNVEDSVVENDNTVIVSFDEENLHS